MKNLTKIAVATALAFWLVGLPISGSALDVGFKPAPKNDRVIKPLEPPKLVAVLDTVNIEEPKPPTSPTNVMQAGTEKEAWMLAAGIPESDWYYVDCVINGCGGVSAEGGWQGTTRWNTAGSGAYGLCQALPASKMASAGADYMTNPITQLRWCSDYARQYGGWAAAWEFRKCLGGCYSARTGGIVNKDHTWW